MAKITFTIQDTPDGDLDFSAEADPPFKWDLEAEGLTAAQTFATAMLMFGFEIGSPNGPIVADGKVIG